MYREIYLSNMDEIDIFWFKLKFVTYALVVEHVKK